MSAYGFFFHSLCRCYHCRRHHHHRHCCCYSSSMRFCSYFVMASLAFDILSILLSTLWNVLYPLHVCELLEKKAYDSLSVYEIYFAFSPSLFISSHSIFISSLFLHCCIVHSKRFLSFQCNYIYRLFVTWIAWKQSTAMES